MARVLIIEDDPKYRDLYADTLIDSDYQIIMAKNGEDGLKKLQKYKPSLVLLDLVMPKMDGCSVLAEMRNLGIDVPVFIISGDPNLKNAPEISYYKNVQGVLQKPISFMEIMTIIKGVLEKQSMEIEGVRGELMMAPEFLINSTFAECKLQQVLGQGANGVVYKGTHTGLNVDVAIKILHPEFEMTSQEVGRFIREIKVLTRLKHRNLIQIIDAGIHQNLLFIMTPYIKGKPMDDHIESKTYSINEATPMMTEICEGLSVVHDAGMVHRDLKPQNILITENHIPLLLDFGLARAKRDTKITNKGTLLGTPLYMSPEQCFGHDTDIRSDIYSLGATFYHFIVGHPPFIGPTCFAIMNEHVYTPIAPPHVVAPQIPKSISNIIVRMMQKLPHDRYQSIQEVINEFKNLTLTVT
ncbi:protein kinase domain-containing protein [Candidatus Uabimicrobium amorphum]|uniref:non-specific serine/threonine protein kinase n=1 Tax=Uabimicrobium amorphum TaxID=2596890 RepID=A0A5S9INV8_UABAM|nr:protein kinase [Candidatus Uabimicrobium amorphum]BBM84981.1 protein kinase [Candidatus Uabimicrobium amorphum]